MTDDAIGAQDNAPAARIAPVCCAARDKVSRLCLETYACENGELDGIERLSAEWVFAYGSLIWDPGFPFAERHRARIHGFHREYCIKSTRYRGTDADPGLVLGLDEGGSCQGVVYRFEQDLRDETVELLYHREMASLSYEPRLLPVLLADGREIEALTFIAARSSPTYTHAAEDELLARLRRCQGRRGPNRDYAINTWNALKEWGIEDAKLAHIALALSEDAR